MHKKIVNNYITPILRESTPNLISFYFGEVIVRPPRKSNYWIVKRHLDAKSRRSSDSEKGDDLLDMPRFADSLPPVHQWSQTAAPYKLNIKESNKC